MYIFCIIVYQIVGEKSSRVVVPILQSVIGVTTTTPTKLVNGVLVAPNGLALPSQAMEVDVIVDASKLTRITNITPSFESVFALIVAIHV
jgi:hypothetical protein